MTDFAVTPPPAAWESIAAMLDDERTYNALASKMAGFEVPAPSAVWEKISTRLTDDGQYAVVATKMSSFETVPPLQVWDKIADALSAPAAVTINTPAQVIPLRKILYRVLAAAFVSGLIAGGWILFSNKTGVTTELVKNNTVTAPVPSVNPEALKTVPVTPAAVPEATSPAGPQREIPAVAAAAGRANMQPAVNNLLRNDSRMLKYAMVQSLPAFHEGPIVISSAPITDANGLVIRDLDVLTTSSNYIMVTGPNGQQTRISAKFASVIRYLNGNADDTEEYLDKVIKESDTWKKRFQEWRSKISQSSFIPSSANFLDIIEFKNLIQE